MIFTVHHLFIYLFWRCVYFEFVDFEYLCFDIFIQAPLLMFYICTILYQNVIIQSYRVRVPSSDWGKNSLNIYTLSRKCKPISIKVYSMYITVIHLIIKMY